MADLLNMSLDQIIAKRNEEKKNKPKQAEGKKANGGDAGKKRAKKQSPARDDGTPRCVLAAHRHRGKGLTRAPAMQQAAGALPWRTTGGA